MAKNPRESTCQNWVSVGIRLQQHFECFLADWCIIFGQGKPWETLQMPQKNHGRVIGIDWAVPLRCASLANRYSNVQYHPQGSLMFALEAIRLDKNSIEFQFPSNFHQISIKIDPIRTDHTITAFPASRAPGHDMFWAPGLSPDGDQAILHALCFPAVSWPRCIPSRVGCWDVGMLQWFDSVWLRSSWIPSWIWNHLRYRFTEASGYCKNSDLWTAGSFYSDSLHFAPIAFAWKFRSCKTLQLPRTKLMTSPWHHALDLCLFILFIVCWTETVAQQPSDEVTPAQGARQALHPIIQWTNGLDSCVLTIYHLPIPTIYQCLVHQWIIYRGYTDFQV